MLVRDKGMTRGSFLRLFAAAPFTGAALAQGVFTKAAFAQTANTGDMTLNFHCSGDSYRVNYTHPTNNIDPQTGKPPEDLEKEIRLLLDGVKATLKEADLTMDDLVSVQVFCPDLTLYDKFNEIYRTYFTKNFPARAFIGSGPLLRGGRFEAQGIAVRR